MAIAPVQSTSGSGSGTGLTTGQTLSGAPTPGNLLLFAVNTGNSTIPTTYTFDTSKWFIIDVAINPIANDQVITLLGRYVQGGDTATMPAFCTAGSGFFSYDGFEVSGVTGTFATDFLCSSTNQTRTSVSAISTFKQHAVANGSLGLVFYAKYNEGSAGTAPPGWTSDINTVNSGNYGSYGCAHLAMNAGDSAQATFTAASSGSNTFGIVQIILTPSQPMYPIVKRSVQRVNGSGFPGALFFGGTPFTGDLVRAYIGWHDGSTAAPTVNTGGGWVNDTNALNGSNPIMLGLYRYAQGGDTNTLPALCTAGSTFWSVTLVELGPAAALSGTFATDHKGSKSAYQASGATLTTTSDTTATDNSLCTTGFAEYNAFASGSNTGADQNANYIDNGDYGWWAGSQISNPLTGATCQTVWTLSSSSDKSGYIQDIWNGSSPVNVNLTGVSTTGVARALAPAYDGNVSLTGAAAVGTVGSPGFNQNSSFTLAGVSAVAVARQIPNTGGFNLVGVASVAHAGAFIYVSVFLQGAQAYPAALPIGTEIAPPICPVSVFSIMRDTAVAISGPMDDGPVVCVGKLCPSDEPQPHSIAFRLAGVACGSRAATVTPFFNVNRGVSGVSSVCIAGTVFGIGNVP